MHHADCGSQYCLESFHKVVSVDDFIVSMSRKGDCCLDKIWGNLVDEHLIFLFPFLFGIKRDFRKIYFKNCML
ncbi:hypothetical protein APS_2776 [Acetobacter pasteurianus subsp. pasteurianus LMG 1262 = NBRC 106471]|nr:hypothetical protein APS_2776 [Acetobacter pasteurianus subsp. pasteurianus LMG 1262 = NBRC 106471]